jgi:hypothetical protein
MTKLECRINDEIRMTNDENQDRIRRFFGCNCIGFVIRISCGRNSDSASSRNAS